MAADAAMAVAEVPGEAAKASGRGGRKRVLLLGLAALLLCGGGGGAGLWLAGLLPGLPGPGGGAAPEAEGAEAAAPPPPAFLDLPDVVANLNTTGRRPVYVKLRSKLELARAEDAAAVQAAMPRLLDLYATYLREMRPEELRGSAGTQRLREELVARANLAVAPARIVDLLFVEILVQ